MSSLKRMLQRHEGLKLRAYDDATGRGIVPGSSVRGHPTIGYGRCLDLTGISFEEADYLLDRDIERVRQESLTLPWLTYLTPARRDVVLAMIFNMGLGGLLKFENMVRAIIREDYGLAAKEMLNSKWADQVGKRAVELAEIMEKGDYL